MGQVNVRLLDKNGKLLPLSKQDKVERTHAEWQMNLTPQQYAIARQADTEAPFSCLLEDSGQQPGVYYCICCELPLFSSEKKFDSGSGWPSYFAPIAAENVKLKTDKTLASARTEVLCTLCDAHLGHVFEDGPAPTGKRFCINGVVLNFVPMLQAS